MVAPHEADPVEDTIAREMARLTFEKVNTIAEVQQAHSRRLASIEFKLDDHGVMLKEHSAKLDSHGAKLDSHGVMLKEHGVMLREILARLPEPPKP